MSSVWKVAISGSFGKGLGVATDFGFRFSLFRQCPLNPRFHDLRGYGTICKTISESVDLTVEGDNLPFEPLNIQLALFQECSRCVQNLLKIDF